MSHLTSSPDPDISDVELLETIYGFLLRDEQWPVWGHVDNDLDRRFDLVDPWARLFTVDSTLLWGVGAFEPQQDQRVGVSIKGLTLISAADEDVNIFVRTLQWIATQGRHLPPEEPAILDAQSLHDDVELPAAGRAHILRRQGALWETTGGLMTAYRSPTDGLSWSAVLNRKALRKYRKVDSVEAYLRVAGVQPVAESDAGGPDGRQAGLSQTDPGNDFGRPHEPPVLQPKSPTEEKITLLSGDSYTIHLDQVLGAGSEGTVYAATGPGDAAFAVKRILLRYFDTGKREIDARYAEREAQVNAALAVSGPSHVLPFFGHHVSREHVSLVTTRAEMSLQDVVRLVSAAGTPSQEPHTRRAEADRLEDAADAALQRAAERFGPSGPDTSEVTKIAIELATGLAQLNETGVLHRDVKPGNAVLFEGRWCWTDLGSARIVSEMTGTYTLRERGTPPYQAPEVLSGASAGHRSDIYGLGCTIYAVLTGAPPFGADDRARDGHQGQLPDLTPITDPRLRTFISATLAKNPGSRPSAEQAVGMLTRDTATASESLRQIAEAAQRRKDQSAIAETEAQVRLDHMHAATGQLDALWAELESSLSGHFPTRVAFTRGQDAWIMGFDDRRLVLTIRPPASDKSPGLLLGTIQVDAMHSQSRAGAPALSSSVANVVATIGAKEEAAKWRVWRVAPNSLAPTRVPVTHGLAHNTGAASVSVLEHHLQELADRVPVKQIVVVEDLPLNVDVLITLFEEEVAAIDRQTDGPSSS